MIGPRPSVRPSVCSQSNHVDDDTELQRIVVDCDDDRGRGDDAMQPEEGEDFNREQLSNTTHPASPFRPGRIHQNGFISVTRLRPQIDCEILFHLVYAEERKKGFT